MDQIARPCFQKAFRCFLRKRIARIMMTLFASGSVHKRSAVKLLYIRFEKHKETLTKYRRKDHKLKIEARSQMLETQGTLTLHYTWLWKKKIYSDLLTLEKNEKLAGNVLKLSKICAFWQ